MSKRRSQLGGSSCTGKETWRLTEPVKSVFSTNPCEVIRLLEKGFGQDVAGLIELTPAWSKLTRSPWRDL
ncbi:hypothetical protein PHMEG_0009489 [Phytophthora megakarya]|uniref:Uncharacterized protein n=1 Tax=Phytophthora megakarya TaxID=4795 RepID=A0A225WGP1_9STRA|nr:hypothetical protein PHMEG_0009489 [Phytophthora megakarya]